MQERIKSDSKPSGVWIVHLDNCEEGDKHATFTPNLVFIGVMNVWAWLAEHGFVRDARSIKYLFWDAPRDKNGEPIPQDFPEWGFYGVTQVMAEEEYVQRTKR